MKATGRHLLVEYMGCDREILNNRSLIEELMQAAAIASETTIVTSVFHPFFPQGISGVVVIEESHLSIHTWPEHGYAAVDFFTCGKGVPERAHEVLKAGLKALTCEIMVIQRGLLSESRVMETRTHFTEEGEGRTYHLPKLKDVSKSAPADQLIPQIRQAHK